MPAGPADGTGVIDPEQRLFTIPRAAKVLDLHRNTVWNLVWKGDIPSVQIGRSRRIKREHLDEYVNNLKPAEPAA